MVWSSRVEDGVERAHGNEGCAEHGNLGQQRLVRAQKLREERDVEHDPARVQRSRDVGVHHDTPAAMLQRGVVVKRLGHRRAPGLDAEIDQIERAGDLHDVEQLG
jgi:hypothetical protein